MTGSASSARSRRLFAAGSLAAISLGAACRAESIDDTTSAVPVSTARIPTEEWSIDAGSVTIHAQSIGSADADDTVITVHGGPGLDLEAMQIFDELLEPGRRIVGYDQRGAGRSTAPDDMAYGLDAQVADLEAVRTALGAETVQLVGQSWGGAVAAAYAARHPERVSALVLIGAVPLDRDEFRAGQVRFSERVDELQRSGLVPDPLPGPDGTSCAPTFVAVLPAYLAEPGGRPDVSIGTCNAATSRATYEAFVADDQVEQLGAALGRFSGPALLLMGEKDAFGIGWLERSAGLLLDARVQTVIVPAAGHLVAAEQPDLLLTIVDQFLTG